MEQGGAPSTLVGLKPGGTNLVGMCRLCRDRLASALRLFLGSTNPNLQFEIQKIIVEGKRVVTRWHLTGTHTGAEFQGFPVGGRRVAVDGISIFPVEGGMVTEGFDSWNQLLFRQQLGGGSTLWA